MLRQRSSNQVEIHPGFQSNEVEQILQLQNSMHKAKRSLFWGFINACFLSIIIYDLTFRCQTPSFYSAVINYSEYMLIFTSILNIIYHLSNYFILIIGIKKAEHNINNRGQNQRSSPNQNLSSRSAETTNIHSSTPLNLSARSWRSDSAHNESHNFLAGSPSWPYYKASPKVTQETSAKSFASDDTDFIANEKILKQYLYEYENIEKVSNSNNTADQTTNLLSTFWNNSTNHTQNDASMYLKKQPYLISQATSVTDLTNTTGNDEGSPLSIVQKDTEIWKKLQVEPHSLTQCNANLRMWISQTILERLVNEVKTINHQFQNHHLNDVQIGLVGLERLRKTAQQELALQIAPTFTAVLPFLEVTSNQEYLIQRFKDLVKGGCMSEFKWNGGGKYNGKDWDDSLPTDSAIIMHCLSTYLDSQLLPLPSKPDAKPFSKEHYIRMNEKIPKNPGTLVINQVSEKPPHYRVIIGEEIYETSKGHNNLFHTILLFLNLISKKEHGMLGKVNMGKSGVNMLWIIDT